ncbi:hypothetical protein ACIOZL_42510 [Streptomyces sp. NPDC087769]|uniref:hypothetical protein n=1 Tax=Streptomyces sp. NPDC087769 TaxID=3365802 RepID=UPI00380AF25A
MLNAPPSPIAVVGPVEPPLLVARVRHYRCPDIERFLIAFHLPDHVPDTQQHDLQTVLRELGILPTATSSGAYAQNYDFTEKKAKYFTGRQGVSTSAPDQPGAATPGTGADAAAETAAAAPGAAGRRVGSVRACEGYAGRTLNGQSWRPRQDSNLRHPLQEWDRILAGGCSVVLSGGVLPVQHEAVRAVVLA